MQKHEDVLLVEQLKEGSPEAHNQIYDKYSNLVYLSAYKVLRNQNDAEDVKQEVFEELWSKKETLEITTSLRGYLSSAAINRSLNKIKKNKTDTSRNQIYSDKMDQVEYPQVDPDIEKLELIKEKLKDVPKKGGNAFRLVFLEGKSHKEAAEITQTSITTIRSHIYRVQKYLLGQFRKK